jgi:autotransporter-associated beta strand protein
MILRLYGAANTYTGVTDVRGGRVELIGSGELRTTSKIVLHEDEESWNGMLYINNLEGLRTNRVGDDIPIEFRGGTLQVDGAATVEKLGRLDFAEGQSTVDPEGMTSAASLTR